jgi:tetratricopeptide (TPR) repeat protein
MNKSQHIINIARELLHSMGMFCYVSEETKSYLEKICNGRSIYESREDIYDIVIELLKDIDDQEARILLFEAYTGKSASFSPLSIETGNKIIKNARSQNEATEYKYRVGIQLYKSNKLVEAEKLLSETYKEDPSNYLYCRWLAEVYVKMNDLDKALSILYEYKNGPYFKPRINFHGPFEPSIDNTPIIYINGAIKNIEDKKARGYVFRPRKNKFKSP